MSTSFRDPAGEVMVFEHEVLRIVHAQGRDELEAFFESETVRRGMERGDVVSSDVLEPSVGAEVLARHGTSTQDDVLVVRHGRVPFPSHPYEWPPEMLHAAAACTLDLHEGLVGEGLGLKDATPYNVLFAGPHPVFIDALSVERRDPHDPTWTPYGQFIRTFLLPLLVARDLDLPPQTTLLTHRDGLRPEAVYRMTPWSRRLRRPYRSLVSFPTWLAKRAEAQGEGLYAKKHMKNVEQVRFTLAANVRSLRRHLRRVAPSDGAVSDWSAYMETRDHYDQEDAARKDAFVAGSLEATRPDWVLDVGCNTGHFSAIAARAGASVVAIDLDPVSVGRVWRRAVAERLDILPLVVDVARPTPSVGWRNVESPSFLERAEARFDLVLFLAVMHHLHVTERIPLVEIVRLAHHLTRKEVVFEYVGPSDPMFRRLLRGRGHLHEGLDRSAFEAALEGLFEVVHAEPLAGTDRVLYRLERVEAEAAAPQVAVGPGRAADLTR